MPCRVRAVLVLVTVSLGGSALLAVERPPKTVTPTPRRLVQPANSARDAFLQALQHLWAREGSYIDPFGNPSQSTSSSGRNTPTTDSGSYIDPFGGH